MLIHLLNRKKWIFALVVGLCVIFVGTLFFANLTGDMAIGLMGSAEQASISHIRIVEGVPSGDTMKVTVQNYGGTNLIITLGYANGNQAFNINLKQGFIIPKASSQEITLTFPNGTFVYGSQYQMKLITAKGNTLADSLTYDSTSTSKCDPLKDDVDPTPTTLHITTPETYQERSAQTAKWLLTSLILTTIADVGACLFANYVLQPKNKGQLFVLLFLITAIVVFGMITIWSNFLFPPMTIG